MSIWGERLEGTRVLDLFAGSGAVALEALGRGALDAVAVEGDEAVAEVLLDNLRLLAASGLELRRGELPIELQRMLRQGAGPFDLVFADPPYRFTAYGGLLRAIEPLLAADGEVAVEHSRRIELPAESVGGQTGGPQTGGPQSGGAQNGRLVKVDVRRYGESALSFFRRSPR